MDTIVVLLTDGQMHSEKPYPDEAKALVERVDKGALEPGGTVATKLSLLDAGNKPVEIGHLLKDPWRTESLTGAVGMSDGLGRVDLVKVDELAPVGKVIPCPLRCSGDATVSGTVTVKVGLIVNGAAVHAQDVQIPAESLTLNVPPKLGVDPHELALTLPDVAKAVAATVRLTGWLPRKSKVLVSSADPVCAKGERPLPKEWLAFPATVELPGASLGAGGTAEGGRGDLDVRVQVPVGVQRTVAFGVCRGRLEFRLDAAAAPGQRSPWPMAAWRRSKSRCRKIHQRSIAEAFCASCRSSRARVRTPGGKVTNGPRWPSAGATSCHCSGLSGSPG